MGAMIKSVLISLFIFSWTFSGAQQMSWTRLAEDTIYYANEYLPDHVMVTPPGPAQIWDFRSLRAPYAVSRRVLITGERDDVTLGHLVNGKQSEWIMKLKENTSMIIQMIEENPLCKDRKLSYVLTPAKKPFYHGVLGESFSYRGKMQAVFAWPRDINCQWTPSNLPDSCRITYQITEEIAVDGEGTLYLPTEVSSVYRQHINAKRTARVETKYGAVWKDVTGQVPGLPLISYTEILRFVAADSGLPLADIEIKDDINPSRIEFKTHPLVTRILSDEPSRPDVFAYPNPSFDIVRFQLSDLLYGKYKLRIFNILGVPVRELEIDVDNDRKTISVDLGDLQRGTYLYRLQDSFGRTIRTKRLVLIQP